MKSLVFSVLGFLALSVAAVIITFDALASQEKR